MSDTEGERPAQGPPQSEAHLLKHGENQHEADSEEAGDRDEEAGDVNMEPVDDIGLATGDIDLDQVNDNLQDFGDDNLSLEVQLGDGSSCHASDVSSLSFQNIVLEDADTENLEDDNLEIHTSRRDSEESSDSYQNEITEADAESFSGALEEEIKRKNSKQGRKPSARSEEGNYEDDVDLGDDLFEDTGTLKRKSNLSLTASDQGQSDNQGAETDNTQTTENVTSDSSPSHMDTGSSQDALPEESSNEHAQSEGEAVSAAVGASDGNAANADNIDCPINNAYSRNSMDGTTQPHIQIHKRNSLEIRNNIPNVNEVKNYNSDNVDLSKYHNSGAVPKMKKKSPGLARRLNEEGPDNSDRDTSSSEKESEQTCIDTTVTSAQELFNARLKNGNLASFAGFKSTRAIQQQQTNGNEEGSEPPSVASSVNSDEAPKKGVDVENEYDYVKYARIQKGDSYVGMRLAYSSSNDSLNLKRNSWGGRVSSDDDHYPGSSRENSPEKIIQQQQRNAINEHIKASKVNEDTLTEIPLNGSDNAQSEDQRNFSLSPEATECDSAEVESVLSDEGKSSTSGMPAVEDGLSSSQGSDAEDLAMHESQRPAEILKRRHKAEVDHELSSGDQRHLINLNEDHNPEDRSPSTESSPTERTKRSRDDLDLAIKDIKTAIRQSKSITLKSPYQDEDGKEQEPIWVMRDVLGDSGDEDSYIVQPRNFNIHATHQMSLHTVYSPTGSDLSGDSYVRKLQRQEEMRRVREEIERQQEEDLIKREQEQVYQVEDDDEKLLKYQYSKNDGKTYASPKGYDSDDAYEDHDRQVNDRTRSRWKEGKAYASVSTGDDDSILRRGNDTHRNFYSGSMYNRYTSRSESALNREPTPGVAISQSHSQLKTSDTPTATTKYTSSTSSAERYLAPTGMPSTGNYANNRESYTVEQYSEDEDEGEEVKEDDLDHNTYIQRNQEGDYDTDEETDKLLTKPYNHDEKVDIPELSRPPVNRSAQAEKRRSRAREVTLQHPDDGTVLIEGVLFRARYLGSTQLISEGQPSKAMRMMQAQEAVGRIKAPEGESQPSTEVDLFVSTEKIMVLNTDLQEIMMDHSLRTISYIADIGDIVVIMARRRCMTSPGDESLRRKKQSKILCHVFESEEAQLIAQSIGQAFQVAYMEFLKANGIEDPGMMKEMDYQEVLNQQEIYGEELFLFANKDMQKEVIVPKLKGEPLGVVIVESGWGSMVPTVVLANMCPTGAAARCGQLNIGDQIISINGISLVGLPLSSCQTYIKAAKNQTVVKITSVPCPPVVEVLIKRPDVKYQLGFSVQNGVICSLLRGGIAERGGVRVGHRIIEINTQSVVAVPHEKIVSMLANSVGEITMKTMPTSIFRLLTGQEVPHYI